MGHQAIKREAPAESGVQQSALSTVPAAWHARNLLGTVTHNSLKRREGCPCAHCSSSHLARAREKEMYTQDAVQVHV